MRYVSRCDRLIDWIATPSAMARNDKGGARNDKGGAMTRGCLVSDDNVEITAFI